MLAKVAVVVPDRFRGFLDAPVVTTPPPLAPQAEEAVDLRKLRERTKREHKLLIRYRDASAVVSERVVWPVLVGYMEGMRSLIAWCELREDFRIFRIDRLLNVTFLDASYPTTRNALKRRWDERHGEAETERGEPA